MAAVAVLARSLNSMSEQIFPHWYNMSRGKRLRCDCSVTAMSHNARRGCGLCIAWRKIAVVSQIARPTNRNLDLRVQ